MFAEKEGIHIVGFCLPLTKAVSVMDKSGNCVVGVDNSVHYSRAERMTMLAHELGHCVRGAFYNEFSPLSLKAKCESKANEWAILNCIPYDALIDAYRDGIYTQYELAEHFGVSEKMMAKAIEYYNSKKGEYHASYRENA